MTSHIAQVNVPETLIPEEHLPGTFRLVLSGWGAASVRPEQLCAILVANGWLTLSQWRSANYYRLHDPRLRFIGGLEGIEHKLAHGQEAAAVFDPIHPDREGVVRVEDVARIETKLMLQFVPPTAEEPYIREILKQAGMTVTSAFRSTKRADIWQVRVEEEEEKCPHYIEGTISKTKKRKPILVQVVDRLIKCYHCTSTDHWSNKCNKIKQKNKKQIQEKKQDQKQSSNMTPKENENKKRDVKEKQKDDENKKNKMPQTNADDKENKKKQKGNEENIQRKEDVLTKADQQVKKSQKPKEDDKERTDKMAEEMEKMKLYQSEIKNLFPNTGKKAEEIPKTAEKDKNNAKENKEVESKKVADEKKRQKLIENLLSGVKDKAVGGGKPVSEPSSAPLSNMSKRTNTGGKATQATLPNSKTKADKVVPGKSATKSVPASRINKRNISISPPSELVPKKSKAKGDNIANISTVTKNKTLSKGKESQMKAEKSAFKWDSDSEDAANKNKNKLIPGGESATSDPSAGLEASGQSSSSSAHISSVPAMDFEDDSPPLVIDESNIKEYFPDVTSSDQSDDSYDEDDCWEDYDDDDQFGKPYD